VGVSTVAERFSRFDPADYLEMPEDIQAYLDAASADGDPAVLAAALGAVARARNMTQLARETGMTREGLYKALSPGGNPAFGTVAKVARALGYELSFRPASSKPVTPERAPRRGRKVTKQKGAA
jgi:probable addiction module antidote protein